MNPIIQDPIGALRAAVESHQRYTQLTGRELDCITLHPEHCRQILALADTREVRITKVSEHDLEQFRLFKMENKQLEQALVNDPRYDFTKGGVTCCTPMLNSYIDRMAKRQCPHAVTSKFTSTGEVYCHDCRQTFTGDIVKRCC